MVDSRNSLLLALVVLQVATLAFMLLIFFNTSPRDAAPERIVIAGAEQFRPARDASAAELAPLLREIVRSEIRLAGAGHAANEAAAAAPPAEQEIRARQQAAASSAAIIHGAVATGVWTKTDTEALLPLIGQVSDEQRMALMDEFYSAVNRQELRINDFPPL
jgi:hypothetical protein